MIKVLNCNSKNYINKLIKFLNLRRIDKNVDIKIVSKILNDIKKNKFKAVLKYEKKFSKNSETKLSKSKINNLIDIIFIITIYYFNHLYFFDPLKLHLLFLQLML